MAFLDITLSDIAAGVLQDRAAERKSDITLQNVQQQNKTLTNPAPPENPNVSVGERQNVLPANGMANMNNVYMIGGAVLAGLVALRLLKVI